MKTIGALLITLSAISPASSVFTIIPGMIGSAGTGAILGMIAAAIVGLFMAFIYAELGSAYPLSGGEYAMIGRILGPFAGFVILGNVAVPGSLIPAVFALGITDYLSVLYPGLPVVPTAIAMILLATAIGCLNIRSNALVTGIFLVVEILALIVLTALGFGHVTRSPGELLTAPVMLSDGALVATPAIAIGLATTVAIFAYNGYGSAVYFAEELHDAKRNIARTILWALAITVLTELVPVVAVLLSAPDLKALLAAPDMFSRFMAERGGTSLSTIVSLGIALAIFNAIIATLLAQARVLYSTGRDACWNPVINRGLATTHKTFDSPWIATLAAGLLSAAACLVPLNILLVVTGTCLVLTYAALAWAVLVGRRNGTLAEGHYRMPLYPLPSIFVLAALAFVIYANWLDTEIGRPSLIVTVCICLVSAAYYLAVLRRRGTWVLQGARD
ncbi:APC family permease [Labrys neptuniae]